MQSCNHAIMQSCKKKGKYLGLGLIVGACFTGTTLATTPPDSPATDSGSGTFALGLRCVGSSVSCVESSTLISGGVTSDRNDIGANFPILAFLPDNDPSGATYPARFYSYAKSSPSPSVAPAVTCSSGTVSAGTYSTSVLLSNGASCAITVTPQANGDLYAGVKYTGTLTRTTGDIYRLTNGTVCGSPYSACSSGTPTNAPIDLHFSKQVESYSTEIELK